MKDYKEIANSIFQRREEYLKEKKRKKALIIRNATIALSCCIMIAVGIGIWNIGMLRDIRPSPDKNDYTLPSPVVTTTEATEPDDTTTTETTIAVSTDDITTTTAASSAASAQSGTSKIKTTSAASQSGNIVTTNKSGNNNNVTTAKTTASGIVITTKNSNSGQSGRTTTARQTSTTTRTSYVRTTTTVRTSLRTSTTTRHATTTASKMSEPVYTRTTTAVYTRPAYTTTTTMRSPVLTSTTALYTRPAYTSTTTWYSPVVTVATSTTRAYTTGPALSTTRVYTTTMVATSTVFTMPPVATSLTKTPQQTSTTFYYSTTTTKEVHSEFNYNGTTYTVAKYNDVSKDDCNEQIHRSGIYDIALGRLSMYTVYSFGNYDPDLMCIVEFDDGALYLGINPNYTPNSLGELLDAMDASESLMITSSYDYEKYRFYSYPDTVALNELFKNSRDVSTAYIMEQPYQYNKVDIYFYLLDSEDNTDIFGVINITDYYTLTISLFDERTYEFNVDRTALKELQAKLRE